MLEERCHKKVIRLVPIVGRIGVKVRVLKRIKEDVDTVHVVEIDRRNDFVIARIQKRNWNKNENLLLLSSSSIRCRKIKYEKIRGVD